MTGRPTPAAARSPTHCWTARHYSTTWVRAAQRLREGHRAVCRYARQTSSAAAE
ncbi:hypothetical protein ACFW9O_36020 [Streptomyces sp. NPDC059499]|uniref:hypothetical protein n=1 Tax=Streptomyces sp. NPDC059499 TaxID=3346852 RepID=UPI0036BB44B4